MTVRILHGDCIANMKTLPDESVHCVVTSPPYWGLRDYGVDGQIGLEQSPAEYLAKMVEVFREVRRVLRPDGTCWVNMGDCYATGAGKVNTAPGGGTQGERWAGYRGGREGSEGKHGYEEGRGVGPMTQPNRMPLPGLKPKDLVGMPWRLAFALQQPYYTGKVADERDRVWLAAMLDAEGSICGTEYQTGERTKTNIYISITNTSVPIIDKCERLFPQDLKHVYEKTNANSNRRCFRWDVERMETKALFIREIYPYLVAKRKQAILGYTFLEMQRGLVSKKKGYLPDQHEQRSWLMASLSKLNAGEDVDLPDWVIEPPTLFEQGWFLRQDVVWAKPNPMPESVRDRCTKAHEYIFLLSKSERYYFDAEAIAEPLAESTLADSRLTREGYETGRPDRGFPGQASQGSGLLIGNGKTRNKRSVWTITTKPFTEAHFATFPPELPEICIKAGSRPGDTILDPFFGAGTTGLVADRLGRDCIGIELNPEYAAMAQARIDLDAKTTARAQQPLFDEIAA